MAASTDQKTRQLYGFGPFRVDPEKELLLRDDETVQLAPKAFQVLLVLMRHSRQLVTKDDLLKMVWPDTFVEEANLSRNIFLLRKALGENPQDHQYIVTVPGRGYRFAEDVQLVPDLEVSIVAAQHSKVQLEVKETRPWNWRKIALAGAIPIAAAAVLAVVASRSLLLRRHQPVPLNTGDSILVADFTNLTGDPVFDHALRQGLEVQLAQSPYLSLISRDRIQQTLHLMDQPADVPVTGQVAREVCVRTGSTAVLETSIQNVGTQYVLDLRATNCRTGDVMDREQAQVARKEDVLGAIGRMATAFRERVGESVATLQRHDVPLAQATTASLDALRAYSLGLEAATATGEEASIPFFRRAIELDPKFAMAYAWLGLVYGASGSSRLATENIRKAYELSTSVSDNERFFISAYYEGRGTGDEEKAHQICEQWAAVYPRDPLPHSFLTGFIDPGLANFDEAIEEGRKGLAIAPDRGYSYVLLSDDLMFAGHLNDVEEVLREASERKVDYQQVPILRYDLAFLRDDPRGMEQAVNMARGKPDSMDWMADQQAFSLAYAGRLKEARVLSRQAIDLALQEGDRERAAQFEIRLALWEAFFGDAREAKQDAATALGLARNRGIDYGAAVVFALSGDSGQARSFADHLQKELPEDTSVRFSYVPVIHAILALKRRDSAAAIDALQLTTPYELGAPRCAVVSFYGSLYPILIRGQAYLAAHKGPEAAREFQKLIDHRTVMIGDAVSALAGLGLAQSDALSGDSNQAREQYREFLALWKNADPDLPVLSRAKAEYAKLR
ncbi:MAG TPA: winged helix-turn-helix domain-containing protein [Terracidiphilus sp.]|nr:winged helix-turn-helix domain-containing protein [Terracidiphilus sp.]